MKLANLKIGQRLSLAFGAVLTLLAVLTGVGIANMSRLNDATTMLAKDNWVKARLANTALDNTRGSIARVFQIVDVSDEKEQAKAQERLGANAKGVKDALDTLAPMLAKEESKALLATAKGDFQQYQDAIAKVLAANASGKREEARNLAYAEAYPAMHKLATSLRAQVDFQDKLFDDTALASAATYASSRANMLTLGAVALLLGLVFGYIITRSITGPIAKAVSIAQTVARGDLTSGFDAETTDETGQLIKALKEMNDSLLKIVSQVRDGTDSMASASSEIAQGNLDLSSRTEQQASSLEETASSMEEMTSTVKQNGDNARQANTLAQSASQVAVKGGAVVAQVVDTMGAINDSSRKIVDIISVIDGIAFQTNILALNAAVEAARAGEQGRGFAVVASEVRNLAQRSAAAAKEIKQLIDDSVEKVDFGSKLVGQAGSTMEEIVASVQRVTDIMGEITSASREQEAGIEQINQAVTEMDTVTQQNAALVEEAAAAAAALQEQAGQLAEVVSVFKIHEVTAARAPVSAKVAPQRKPARRALALVGAASSGPRMAAAGGGDWESF